MGMVKRLTAVVGGSWIATATGWILYFAYFGN